MVPSGPMALELWKSSRGMAASAGRYWGWDVSNRRSTVAWRGPAYGLRPVCCASCWYIGLPAARAGAGEAAWAGAAGGDVGDDGVLPLHAASKPLPPSTTATLALESKRRRLMSIRFAAYTRNT